jgi:hypothetical protein
VCRLVIGTVVEEKEEVDKTKGVIRIRRKDRQQNDQKDKKKKDKKTNNDLQNITHSTKDRITRTPQKTGGEVGNPEV